ncbi:anti-anti-sigma factor [Sorangium cellulosum]|uniref:Anti-anti-sigma factor n=1 Tax=Sorangium cellulosum TaxID=56 RepID=A0A4P2PZR9_SORCE|nr:PAS domain-containing protein [Sorangium cellulosum]AUX22434.1 anti-anti-sigma factor [Sorangium cellulosum]
MDTLARSPLAVVEYGLDLSITAWNESAARQLGFSGQEAIGRSIAELLPTPEDEGPWRRLLEEDSGEQRLRHARKDGSHGVFAWAHHRVLGAGGEATGVLCIGRDVTAEVEASRRHREQEHILRALVDNLEVVVWASDRHGVFTYYDGKGLASVGMKPGQLVGVNNFDLYKEHETVALRTALRGEPFHNFMEVDGRPIENWFVPVRDEMGEVGSVVGITLDLTESRRAEQELRDRLALIERQQQVIRQLSTPILQVWNGVLALPMIGVVDSARTAEVMDSLLQAIVRTGARFALLDLTGVEAVDTKTAGYLVELVRAIRLLGAEGIITGIRPSVAQTVVALGLDLAEVTTLSDLQAGLKHCIGRTLREERARVGQG